MKDAMGIEDGGDGSHTYSYSYGTVVCGDHMAVYNRYRGVFWI